MQLESEIVVIVIVILFLYYFKIPYNSYMNITEQITVHIPSIAKDLANYLEMRENKDNIVIVPISK